MNASPVAALACIEQCNGGVSMHGGRLGHERQPHGKEKGDAPAAGDRSPTLTARGAAWLLCRALLA